MVAWKVASSVGGRDVSGRGRSAQLGREAVLIEQHAVPGVQLGGQRRRGHDAFEQLYRPDREIDPRSVGVPGDIAEVVEPVVGVGLDRVPVGHEHFPEVGDPSPVCGEGVDLPHHEHGVVVGERVDLGARDGPRAGQEHGAHRWKALRPRDQVPLDLVRGWGVVHEWPSLLGDDKWSKRP